MLIKRSIISQIINSISESKIVPVLIIYGPRQSGKTTLIKMITDEIGEKTGRDKILKFTGDDLYAQSLFGSHKLEPLRRTIGSAKMLILDEAQRIDNIGLTLKLLVDNWPITVIASGSASFDLANKINEPLTGRSRTFWLYPFSYQEIHEKYRQTAELSALEECLRYGMYPKVQTLSSDQDKQDYLYEYLNSYLYKDILAFETIRKPKRVIDLLTLLSLQIGQEVSIAELSQNLAMSQKAAQNYLDVLEKMFVLVNLRGFSRNLRKEIYKTSKYYFVDVGLRNALIRNFNPLRLRADAGALFENWFIMEKIKLASNSRQPANFHFWRTYDQQEIDLIEEYSGKLTGYECKWSAKKVSTAPRDWQATYQNASFYPVNSENFSE